MTTLNNAGIDTSKYFDVQLPDGNTIRMKMENGVPVVADVDEQVESDPILEQIFEDGYVKNTKLYRRFVMAQMFKMLNYHSYDGREIGFDAALRSKGYDYQFKMMLEEIRVISKLESRDKEAFAERTAFFNKDVVVKVCEDYLTVLKDWVDKRPKKNCKGNPYVTIKGKDIFVEDLQKKVYAPVQRQINGLRRCQNYVQLYHELRLFKKSMVRLPWRTKLSKTFVDAYKGAGGYYTLMNLVKYHGCGIYTYHEILRDTDAVDYIQCRLSIYKGEGWRYMAMLKKCIEDNRFSFDTAMKQIYS